MAGDGGYLANASVTAPALPPAPAAAAPCCRARRKGLALVGTVPNPKYAQLLDTWPLPPGAGLHPADRQVRQGLRGQHLGAAGHRHRRVGRHGDGPDDFDKVAKAGWFDVVLPFDSPPPSTR
jgi:hypothetical protein